MEELSLESIKYSFPPMYLSCIGTNDVNLGLKGFTQPFSTSTEQFGCRYKEYGVAVTCKYLQYFRLSMNLSINRPTVP